MNESDADASPVDREGTPPERAASVPQQASPDETVPDAEARRLDPRVITAWRLAVAVRAAVLVGAAVFADRVWGVPLPPHTLPIAAILAGVALLLFWPPAQYRAWSFRLRERDLFVRHGVLWRTASIIPHARIQHVDTRRGPVERGFGLASVVVYTAGIRGADVTIPGLALPDAEALRDRLADLGGEDDGV